MAVKKKARRIPWMTSELAPSGRRSSSWRAARRRRWRHHFGSNVAGLEAACAALEKLALDDFVETVQLDRLGQPADVYAVRLNERDWYVKLYLDVDVDPPHDDVTVCVSFHPPRYDLKTVSGRKVLKWQ